MLLSEHEGKQLLLAVDLPVSLGILITPETPIESIAPQVEFPVFVKAQVLHGNRGLLGLVKPAKTQIELVTTINEMWQAQDQSGQPITQLLIQSGVKYQQACYLSLTYRTRTRTAVIEFSPLGGEGMDERGDSIVSIPISVIDAPTSFEPMPELLPLVQKLWQVFTNNDATLVEINPIVKTETGWTCLDAKIELEDTAKFRQPEWEKYSARSAMGRPPTLREQQAHEVSRSDHRGAAGESFFEFEGGEIGVLAAGGGASILAMDALLVEGLKPANYTEHSGNPPREKVKALTDVILSIPNLKGLFVVGANANFTDIYETMAGVADSLLASPYKAGFPVLVRRGGPRWEEAFPMLKERLEPAGYKLKLFGPDFPIIKTAREMRKLIEETT